MRRIFPLSMLCLAAGVVNACKPEVLIQTENVPTAGIRFVNVVPDTGAMDFRPVDIVENSNFYNVTFRSATLLYYKNARTDTPRHFKIFRTPTATDPSATQIATASTVVVDTTVTLTAGQLYTFILWGFSRTGSTPAMRLTVINDAPADPGALVALRMINAAAGLGALDGRQYLSSGTAPAAATWGAVAEFGVSAYVTSPVTTTGVTIKYNVQPAGGGTALFTDASAPAGLAETVDLDALPGTAIAGSAVTGIVVPRSVLGSQAASFTTPSILFVWDRRPPRCATIVAPLVCLH